MQLACDLIAWTQKLACTISPPGGGNPNSFRFGPPGRIRREAADTRAHRGGPRRRRDERCGRADQSALLGRRADRRVMAGYDGPVVDAFLHTPWGLVNLFEVQWE